MSLNLSLPSEVVEALGPDPERGALEAVLLFLIDEEKMSVARAGEILGLGGGLSAAARWYASRGSYRRDYFAGEYPAEGATHAEEAKAGEAGQEHESGLEPVLGSSSSLPAEETVARARARPYEPVGLPLGKGPTFPPGEGVSDQLLEDKRACDY